MVFMDAIHYHVLSEGQIVKKVVYIAIGIDLDGRKDVLGMWVGENESAKYWATVLNSLKNRGIDDIFIACTDNLTGFSAAIEAIFPRTEVQNCIIHQLRNSSKYVSYKDIKELMKDLKAVYGAVDEQSALDALDNSCRSFSGMHPRIAETVPCVKGKMNGGRPPSLTCVPISACMLIERSTEPTAHEIRIMP